MLIDELIPSIERFDSVMKSTSNIVFRAVIRERNLVRFVNPALLPSANLFWIETEIAESMIIIKSKMAQ